MNPNKRRECSPVTNAPKRLRKVCSYGDSCYRRNPAHLREFSHPHLESILDNYTGSGAFPIPEELRMQKQMIEEQLQIMIENNIYTPGTRQSGATNSDAVVKTYTKDEKTKDIASDGVFNTGGNVAPIKTKDIDDLMTTQDENKTDGNIATAGTTKTIDLTVTKDERKKDFKVKNNNSVASTSVVETKTEGAGVVEVKVTDANVNRNASEVNYTQTKNVAATESKKPEGISQATLPGASSKVLAYSDYRPIVQPKKRAEDYFKVVLPRGGMAQKHRKTSPYFIFYTTITASKETHNQKNSITFQEILDSSLGELKCSLQINFMVDIGWLLAQYYFAGYSQKRLTVLYGDDSMPDIRTIGQKQKHIDTHYVNMGSPFGKHHTKMMILCYEDGSLRVVISTANLYTDDWENRTQGLWMSPACPELPEGAMPHEGESPTLFKKSLLMYLDHYRMGYLTQYIERVRRCDFSHINVFLVASAPGGHTDASWGMARMSSLLSQHCYLSQKEPWGLIAQSSSIGSYGSKASLWLTGDFQSNFTRVKNESALVSSSIPKLRVIYPSLENVQLSHDGLLGGGCLPYSASVHTKQPWLNEFLCQWRARSTARDKAMPHIKSYLRVSPDHTKAAYYLLTSANISKAAWGTVNKGNKQLRIMSYEAGVLFLPRFVINRDFFPLEESEEDRLCLAYDLPPVPYTGSMSPWVQDYLF